MSFVPSELPGELFGERVEIWQTIAGNLDVGHLSHETSINPRLRTNISLFTVAFAASALVQGTYY
jgi:hypothetical protein